MTRTPQPGDLTLITPDERGSFTPSDAADTDRWGLIARPATRRVEYVIAATHGPRWLRIETVEQHAGWWVRDADSITETTLADVVAAVRGQRAPGAGAIKLRDLALDLSYFAVRDFRWGHAERESRHGYDLAFDLLDELWNHGGPGLGARVARSRREASE